MKRKVIKQGHNTLTITLPSKWVNANKIKPADEVEIDDSSNTLHISELDNKTELKKAELDLTNLDFAFARRKIRSAYKSGFDLIFLQFDNTTTIEYRTGRILPVMSAIDHEVNNLLGCEIIQQTKNTCLIKDYSFSSLEEFDNLVRKIFLMMLEYSNEFLEHAGTMDKPLLENMHEKHFNVMKFILFCQRLLNKEGYNGNIKSLNLYYILSTLDDVLDIYKYAARYLSLTNLNSLKKETLAMVSRINEQLRTFYEFFYKPDTKKLLYYGESRWRIINDITNLSKKISANELILLTNLEHSLELYLHLYEARMSLDYNI